MPRKKYIKLPKIVSITCRHCSATSKRAPPENGSPQFFDCDKCGQRMTTPVSACCIICAYTEKKCPATLVMEAKMRGLELR